MMRQTDAKYHQYNVITVKAANKRITSFLGFNSSKQLLFYVFVIITPQKKLCGVYTVYSLLRVIDGKKDFGAKKLSKKLSTFKALLIIFF